MSSARPGAFDANETPPQESGSGIPDHLMACFDRLTITPVLHRHPPLHTVEQSQALRGQMPGLHVKNMFLKDKKGGLWLVTCREDRKIRIKDLEAALGSPRLSFGKPELLLETLGVLPGSVTPLAMIHPAAQSVTLILDQAVTAAAQVNCHPLHNEATVTLDQEAFARFVAAHAPKHRLVDFDALEHKAAAFDA
ncbi:MAG: prolyl-tRNA synthetase associated domain-containing protein [Neomegalonema sp.]|nr:prolyl-tRNA synthetase associated domain-containing protein [Neomegalonema sp.]